LVPKHVLRSMNENARQGNWNGARPPFGYSTIEVERWGCRRALNPPRMWASKIP